MDLSSYVALYDDEIGIVWFPRKGILKATDKRHAELIAKALEELKQGKLTDREQWLLEDYLEKESGFPYFENDEAISCNSLLERNHLERLEIMTANVCNLKCRYCYADEGSYGKTAIKMASRDVVTYLEALLTGGIEYIHSVMFFGGEPTLCPDTILSACDFFTKKANEGALTGVPIFSIVTNGTLLTEKMLDIIEKYRIHVTISIDGPEDITNYLRIDKNGIGVYDRVAKAINRMNVRNIPIRLIEATYTTKHIEMGYTKKEIEDFIKNTFKVEKVIVNNCEETASGSALSVEEDLNHINIDFCSYKKVINRMKGRKCVDLGCESGFGSFVMAPNGDLYPCHYFVADDNYIVAKFRNGRYDYSSYPHLLEIFENAHHLKNPQCKECWAKYTCNMCPANLFIHNMAGCDVRKEMQKKILIDYAKEHLLVAKVCEQE